MNSRRIALLALWLAVALPSFARAEDCTLKIMADLDMVGPDSDGRIVIEVLINGAPHKFMVDTGGVYTEISEALVASLGLSKRKIAGEVYSVDGSTMTYGVIVPSVALGRNEAKDFRMLVMPDTDDGIEGVISPDLLQSFDVDLDMKAHKLKLFSPDHCEGKVVYWAPAYSAVPFKMSDGYHIGFSATLDGKSLGGILDTGAYDTWLGARQAHLLFSVDEGAPGVDKTDGTIGGEPVLQHRFQSLAVGGVAVQNPLIMIKPMAAELAYRRNHTDKTTIDAIYGSSLQVPPLIFGMNIISKLHTYIAYGEHVLYVTAADAH